MIVMKRFKIRSYEMGLYFRGREFKGLLAQVRQLDVNFENLESFSGLNLTYVVGWWSSAEVLKPEWRCRGKIWSRRRLFSAYNTLMFLRPHYRTVDGKRHAYWSLVESVRTECGPRQRVVAYLGGLDEAGRLGVQQAADPNSTTDNQPSLFDNESAQPRYVDVDVSKVRVENCREFGGPWLAWQLIRRLGLDEFLQKTIPRGGEEIRWSVMSLVLVIARLCRPSSELHIAEHFYRQTALSDILGIPDDKVNDARLYRTLKLCSSPDGDEETFILCRSRDRREKDEAILRRFEERIASRLESKQARCEKQRRDPQKVEREIGLLLGKNTRAAGLFEVKVKPDENGHAKLTWKKLADRRDWAMLSAGCYLLRSNVRDWSDKELWKAYIQLTEAEAAFRIHKSDRHGRFDLKPPCRLRRLTTIR